VLDTAFAIAATQGVSRIELEARLRPAARSYSVFGHVSQLRSSVARVARDGSLRVTARIHSRRRREREREPIQPPLTAAATLIARGNSLQETVTVVTQRFLGARGSSVTHLRSFTRIVPVGSAWTVDAIALLRTGLSPAMPANVPVAASRGQVTPGPAPQRAAVSSPQTLDRSSAAVSAKIPTFVLHPRLSPLHGARWLRRRERPVAPPSPPFHAGLTLPAAIQRATSGELAVWAVSATSRLIVERLLLPYLRRLAAQHVRASKGKLVWELGSLAVPLGLRLLASNPVRGR
jgi:hypothetical protein